MNGFIDVRVGLRRRSQSFAAGMLTAMAQCVCAGLGEDGGGRDAGELSW